MKWQVIKKLLKIGSRVARLEKQMAETRQQFDAKLAALPNTIATAVVSAVKTAIQPLVDKANASQEDFTTETQALDTLPQTIAAAVTAGLADVLNPPAEGTGTAETPTEGETGTDATPSA